MIFISTYLFCFADGKWGKQRNARSRQQLSTRRAAASAARITTLIWSSRFTQTHTHVDTLRDSRVPSNWPKRQRSYFHTDKRRRNDSMKRRRRGKRRMRSWRREKVKTDMKTERQSRHQTNWPRKQKMLDNLSLPAGSKQNPSRHLGSEKSLNLYVFQTNVSLNPQTASEASDSSWKSKCLQLRTESGPKAFRSSPFSSRCGQTPKNWNMDSSVHTTRVLCLAEVHRSVSWGETVPRRGRWLLEVPLSPYGHVDLWTLGQDVWRWLSRSFGLTESSNNLFALNLSEPTEFDPQLQALTRLNLWRIFPLLDPALTFDLWPLTGESSSCTLL